MKILGDFECFKEKNFLSDEQQSASKKEGIKTSETLQSSKQWLKKKCITPTPKRAPQQSNISAVYESKQNKLKKQITNLHQHQQSSRANSNICIFSTPFRMKNNNNYIEETPMFVKSQNKNHCTEIMMGVSKQFSPYGSVRSDEMKEIEKKFLEGKMDNLQMWQNKHQQNKKKSFSYRVHNPSRQFNFPNNTNNLQRQTKTNTHQPIPSQHDQRRRHQNKTQMDRKTFPLNRQKSSQSFNIKKKFNTNVVIESPKPEQQKFSNRFTYIMQRFKKEHFAEEDNVRGFVEMPYQGVVKSSLSSKYHERTKNQGVESERKQLKQKDHHSIGGRSLKVRVNKLLKQQQNLFNICLSKETQQSSNKKNIFKTEQHERKIQDFGYCTNQQIGLAALKKSVKMVKNSYHMEDNDHQKDQNSIVIDHHNVKGERTQSSEEVLKSCSNCDSERKIENNSNLFGVNNQRQFENESILKNRKSKIASIRAIKKYIKRHDNEERYPCPPQQKEPKQFGSVKKKEKQTSCLTHKIKWGNPSKKKINSYKGIDVTSSQFLNECSVQGNMKPKVRRFQIQKHSQKTNQQLPTDVRMQRTCSKPLVGFQDPGISLIANNNDSLHLADTRLILPSFQRLPFQALEMIDDNMISPVAMMKRVKQDVIEEKMESLQELYSELRSHKQKPAKAGNQLLRLNSIEEFFQKQ